MTPAQHTSPAIHLESRSAPEAGFAPCSALLVLGEKVAALEAWRTHTEADLKEIRDVIAQVRLLITLSIGGGGLSIITLILTITRLVRP